MIHFACVYCGKKVRAKDTQACRTAKCPACGHALRVPPKARRESGQTAAVSQTEERRTDTPDRWEGKSNKEIARLLLKRPPTPIQESRLKAKQILEPLLPQYDDLTIFALSAAFLLLGLTGPGNTTRPPHDPLTPQVFFQLIPFAPGMGGLSLLAGLGLVVSLAGAVFNWAKPRWIRFAMLYFAVFATGGIAVAAALLVLTRTRSWPLLIFPLWNGINGAILMAMFYSGVADVDCVVDCKPSLRQLAITLVSVSLLLAICRYAFNLHWAITYSICVCYTMSLNHTLQDLFGRRSGPAEPETPAQVQ